MSYTLAITRYGKPPIVLSGHTTKADAMRAQMEYVRRWRWGHTPEMDGLPYAFTAPSSGDTRSTRTYRLRYGSSRYTLGKLVITKDEVNS